MNNIDNRLIELSNKIAEATVPEESELAPIMTIAFIEGGIKKKKLFMKPRRSGLGAFGTDSEMLLFKFILQGIANASTLIHSYLSTHEIHLGIVSTLDINVLLYLLPIRTKKTDTVANEKNTETAKQISKDELESFQRILEKLSLEFKEVGIPEEKCDRIAAVVLITLANDPAISLEFVEKLAASK